MKTLTLSNILALDETELRRRVAEAAGIYICPGCNHEIDPECCHCGDRIRGHKGEYHETHAPVPMGCTCGYEKADEMRAAEPACPNYCASLDAILPLARTLNTIQLEDYAGALRELSGQPTFADALLRATPLQHAAAFLFATQGE